MAFFKGNLSVLVKYCGKPDMLDTRSLQKLKVIQFIKGKSRTSSIRDHTICNTYDYNYYILYSLIYFFIFLFF